jgi:DNA-binding GntR family transcriptional regulator
MTGTAKPHKTARLRIRSAPEAAAQIIRDAILEGRLKPGARILEQHWAATLGIGQPTLREGLKELEYQGLVTRNPRRGTYVSELSPKDCAHLLEVRMSLEILAVDRATRRMNASARQEFDRLILVMQRAADSCDTAGFHDADLAFHRAIWELADNQPLTAALEMIAVRLFIFPVLVEPSTQPREYQDQVRQHKGILEGLCSGDPEKARTVFVENALIYWRKHGIECAESALRPVATTSAI